MTTAEPSLATTPPTADVVRRIVRALPSEEERHG